MSEPTPTPEPRPAPGAADEPTVQPPAPNPPAPPPASAVPPPGYPPAYWAAQPFAPVPREPWINPARRGALIGVGIAAAVVLFGAGFGAGWGAAPSGPDHFGPRIERGGYPGVFGGHPNRHFPGVPKAQPPSNVAPTPSPSTTK